MKKLVLVITNMLLVLFLLSSCAKDDENTPANLLVSKTWKKGVVDKNVNSNPPGRVFYNPWSDCKKDDLITFDSNGKLTVDQGKVKCESKEPLIRTMSYTYDKVTKQLTIDGALFTVAEESKDQIKYYSHLPSHTGYDYMVYLLQ